MMEDGYMTMKDYEEMLRDWKEETNWFDGSIGERDMYEMLRQRMGFGIAETNVIMAALVLAGAKFGKWFD